jgi:hemoglobin-like flavoprotein
MTPEQIALVQSTYEKVHPIREVAAKMFYKRLFETAPQARPLFKGDMEQQGRMLMQALGFSVRGLDRPETILSAVQELGVRHLDYCSIEEGYEVVGAALLWTLEQGLGEDFTPEVKEAWTEAYSLLSSIMKDAAAQAK